MIQSQSTNPHYSAKQNQLDIASHPGKISPPFLSSIQAIQPISAPNESPYQYLQQQRNNTFPPLFSSPPGHMSSHMPMNLSSPSPLINSMDNSPVAFPASPPMPDPARLLLSPSRFRKRRQVSPLINANFFNPITASASHINLMRRGPLPKIPVPSSPSLSNNSHSSGGLSPRSRVNNSLILPCFFDQSNNLRTHGPSLLDGTGPSEYWDDFRRNASSFLEEAQDINEEEITIIEIKQLLRKYSINATGKKHILMDRIKKLQVHLKAQKEQEQNAQKISQAVEGEEKTASSEESPVTSSG